MKSLWKSRRLLPQWLWTTNILTFKNQHHFVVPFLSFLLLTTMTKLLADCQYLRLQTSSESPAVQIPCYSQFSFLPSLKGPLVWEVQDVSCDSGSGTLIEKLPCPALSPKARAAVYIQAALSSTGGFRKKMPVLLWGPILRKALQNILFN